jgi:hypothetical protein
LENLSAQSLRHRLHHQPKNTLSLLFLFFAHN